MITSEEWLNNNSYMVTIVISIIWGIGLSLILIKQCISENCVVVKAPKQLIENNNKIYDSKSKRYFKLEKYIVKCL